MKGKLFLITLLATFFVLTSTTSWIICPAMVLWINSVSYPTQVNVGEVVEITVNVGYSFSGASWFLIEMYGSDGYYNSVLDNRAGSGTVSYGFNLVAPSSTGTWTIGIAAWYWDGSNWVLQDYKQIFISVTTAGPAPSPAPTPNEAPVAKLYVSPKIVGANLPVTLDASKSYDPDGEVVSYFFDFGDGETSGWVSNPEVVHSYAKPGTYYVLVKVMDDKGAESNWCSRVRIEIIGYSPTPPPTPSMTPIPSSPSLSPSSSPGTTPSVTAPQPTPSMTPAPSMASWVKEHLLWILLAGLAAVVVLVILLVKLT